MNISSTTTVTSAVRGDVAPISHTTDGRRLTIDPHEVVVVAGSWTPESYARVTGRVLRQKDGQPGGHVRSISLQIDGGRDRGDELPRSAQPSWLRDVVDNGLRALAAAAQTTAAQR